MDSDTKKKIRTLLASLDCRCPGVPCFLCAYYDACKEIMHFYHLLDSTNTKENEE